MIVGATNRSNQRYLGCAIGQARMVLCVFLCALVDQYFPWESFKGSTGSGSLHRYHPTRKLPALLLKGL